jgi:hypothetical protein
MLSVLDGTSTAPHRNSLYYHYYESDGPHAVPVHYGVITNRYKLVRYPELDEWELFERSTDPNEIQNRYSDETLAETRERLTAELDRLRAELGVPADAAAGPEQP